MAHQWYAVHLSYRGRPAEARTEIERARQLDPTSLIINTASTWLHNDAREYPQAIEDANKALELDPHFAQARVSLALAYIKRAGTPRHSRSSAPWSSATFLLACAPSLRHRSRDPYGGSSGLGVDSLVESLV